MRKKERILSEVRADIRGIHEADHRPEWIQYRMIEVLIDIRDHLEGIFAAIEAVRHTPRGG